ncbi:MAG: 1-acyl-sn-glycerol-3-phosphate acyltransferase [Myxococcota bacterium]
MTDEIMTEPIDSTTPGEQRPQDSAVVAKGPSDDHSAMVRRHARQRIVSLFSSPIWLGLIIFAMRFLFRYRIANVDSLRAQYRRIRAESDAPMLICANHLTMIDSLLIEWALGSGPYWSTHPDELPWNAPESTNFGKTWLARSLIYLLKCIAITRGGPRESIAAVLTRILYLLSKGETALLFPEAGRSRSGRVAEDAGAWGVGRIVGGTPNCRVLCIYLRGRKQESWSDLPAKGDVMDVSMICIEPKSDARGVRRSLDLSRQVTIQLAQMEKDYFDARQ